MFFTTEPAGVWTFNEATQRKEAIDANRKRGALWKDYPKDNMGRYFIEEADNLLVVDIDGEHIVGDPLKESITIPALNFTLPQTIATQTSNVGKYHLYYSLPPSIWPTIGNRIIGFKNFKVDFLCYGFIFDEHFYSPHHRYNELDGKPKQLPDEIIAALQEYTEDKAIITNTGSLHLTSNIAQYNIVNAYLEDKINTVKGWNSFFRLVFPAEYIKKGSKKIEFSNFELSYDLFNKIAVKLTTTSELGTQEHVIPAIHKMLREYGIDPTSNKTRAILNKQILSSLPDHPPQQPYYLMDDQLTIPEHINNQPDTPTPIFRVIIDSQVKYIQLNRYSLEPILHNGNPFLVQKAAEVLNSERAIYNNEGKRVGWDDNVPIVYIANNPYEPQLFADEDNSRNIVNLYRRTRYLKEASPRKHISEDNLIMKLIRSAIHPDYQDLVLLYHAQIIHGDTPPATILWISSLKSDKGGTGKSILTIDILSRILGESGTVIKPEDMQGAWGDTFVGSKCLSLEDLPNMGTREFNKLYAAIKGATSTALRKLNMKGSSFQVDSIETAITGSSNERINLHHSDRRFICLEPAHLRGETEPLTDEDAFYLEEWRRARKDYSSELQDYTDYLLFLYQDFVKYRGMTPPPPEYLRLHRALFIEAPETSYRAKWILGGQNNTESIVTNLKTPLALLDSIRLDVMNQDIIAELFELVITTYSAKTGKTALPWNWFAELLPSIQSDKYHDAKYSKAQIQRMLNIEFTTNVGAIYTADWARKWKVAGYVLPLTAEELKDYQTALLQIKEHQDVMQ